jgi:hypothetical protein
MIDFLITSQKMYSQRQFISHNDFMNKKHLPNYSTILSFYGITPTPIRLETLKAIYASPSEFTAQEALKYISQDVPTVNSNSVMSVLRLFKSRGLLVKLENGNKKDNRGRPITRFCLSGTHILSTL